MTKSDSDAKHGKKAEGKAEADPAGALLCQRVRQLRRKKGWTLEELSGACGVSRSMLSEIERNAANPTLGVAHRIAAAFGMSLGKLVDMPSGSSAVQVIRADDRGYHYRSDKDIRIRTLSPLELEKDVEFYEVSLGPRAALRSAAHFGGTREFLTVQRGSVRIVSGEDAALLGAGDSAHYPADVAHAISNDTDKEAMLFLVVIYRPG